MFKWIWNFIDFFRPASVEEEAERGKQNALEFLATQPSQQEINEYYGDACVNMHFESSDAGKAYAKAVKEVIWPHCRF